VIETSGVGEGAAVTATTGVALDGAAVSAAGDAPPQDVARPTARRIAVRP